MRPITRILYPGQYPLNERFPEKEPLHISVNGKVYKLMPKAIRSYCNDYKPTNGFDGRCVRQISMDLEVALQREPKRTWRIWDIDGATFEGDCMVFKKVGSKIIKIRINLKDTGGSVVDEI